MVQIVDAVMAEAVRKSGSWLACRPGCTDCCMGPFPISSPDAERLRAGLAALRTADPARARSVEARAKAYLERLPHLSVPELLETDAAETEMCPALDPETGMCDLYEARPLTCRVFGPAVANGDVLGMCELCYVGATGEEIAACRVELNLEELEDDSTPTLVAFALV